MVSGSAFSRKAKIPKATRANGTLVTSTKNLGGQIGIEIPALSYGGSRRPLLAPRLALARRFGAWAVIVYLNPLHAGCLL